ncbi:hypothetical protein [Actinomarinicola tropica]|uniref:Uncharacterized protein n=1 Tax=Actinomarinicola tropica TaxID=2789776 RepID=A0A5Q2RLK4_9ACTN|nr:hypothetical protein [Actinomarinicola tropica]QGG95461.1 hypothetical protein GH723_10325 [Actinomarinicola tropica]
MSHTSRPRRDLALSLLVPLLLSTVALTQIARAHVLDQSPWSGAGFGMFAQIDGETTRTVRGWIVEDGATTAVPIPADLERAAFELAVVPTEERADELARRWRRQIGAPESASMRVEVWGLTVEDSDGDHLGLATERMLAVEANP